MNIFQIEPIKIKKEYFKERSMILRYIEDNFNIFPDEFTLKLKLNEIKDLPLKSKLEYLTNITLSEKIFILQSIKNEDLNTILSDLKPIYPELYYYLDWELVKPDNEIENWIIEYLKDYNSSKVKNCKLSSINEILNDKNKNKIHFQNGIIRCQNPIMKKIGLIGLMEWCEVLSSSFAILIMSMVN